jgi:hypothetical protein
MMEEKHIFESIFLAYNMGLQTAMNAMGTGLDREKVSDDAWDILHQVAEGKIALLDAHCEELEESGRKSENEKKCTTIQEAMAQSIFKGASLYASDIGFEPDRME